MGTKRTSNHDFIKRLSNEELLGRLDRLVLSERKLTHVILCHINEVESRRLYAEMGFDSMFKYLTHHCGYGEDSAYRRLQAARLLKKTPEIAEKIEEGSLNLTQLTQVQKCIRQEKQNGGEVSPDQTLQILEQIENKSSYETKKVLALEFNQPIQAHEVITPQRDHSVRLELTLTTEQMERLKQVKDLLSHTLPNGKWIEIIDHLAAAHLKKVFGNEVPETIPKIMENGLKAKTSNSQTKDCKKQNSENERNRSSVDKKQDSPVKNTTQSFLAKRKRGHIKITVRRRVLEKAHHCCEYVDPKTSQKCGSTYQLQVDHKIPHAHGGSDDESNLRALCRTHNLLAARRWGLA